MTLKRYLVIGTRAVIKKEDQTWRVVCATCGAGGTVPHRSEALAGHAAARDSNKPCRACGAK